jgi:hypothetical protein
VETLVGKQFPPGEITQMQTMPEVTSGTLGMTNDVDEIPF